MSWREWVFLAVWFGLLFLVLSLVIRGVRPGPPGDDGGAV